MPHIILLLERIIPGQPVHTHRVVYAHRIYMPHRVASVSVMNHHAAVAGNYRVNRTKTRITGQRGNGVIKTRTIIPGPRGNSRSKTTFRRH